MYTKLHITYSDPSDQLEPLTFNFNINSTSIAQRWATLLSESVDIYTINDSRRLYGFDTETLERHRAVDAINKCVDTINDYKSGFIKRRMTLELKQDDLNYLHHIFEIYHGMLNEPHKFYLEAPKEVKCALGQLNLEVHRCESMAEGTVRKMMPSHLVTYYDQPRGPHIRTLEDDDYAHFTDFYEFGTIYLLYVEIGKTLQDMAIDDDDHIGDEAWKPFRHYASDFIIRYWGTSHESWNIYRKLFKKHYDSNQEFYDARYNYSHIYNRAGNIPLAKIQSHLSPNEITERIKQRQFVSNIKVV